MQSVGIALDLRKEGKQKLAKTCILYKNEEHRRSQSGHRRKGSFS
jgi:hypothetical protein